MHTHCRQASGDQYGGGPVLTVTPNPAWDVTYPVKELRVGESNRVSTPSARAGGKGVNVARVVAQLGGQTVAIAPVGRHRVQDFADSLARAEVPARMVPVDTQLRQSVAVVPEKSGCSVNAPTLFNEAGDPLPDDSWDELIATLAALAAHQGAAVVVVSGSLPPSSTEDRFTALLEAGRSSGAQVLVDTSGPPLVWAARAGADLVKSNLLEALTATGAADLDAAADELHRLGAGSVVITDGSAGMQARQGCARWRAQPAEVIAGNPTGAGDAALAALAQSWAEQWPQRLAHAVAASAAAVHEPVAGHVDPDLVANFRNSVDVEEI